jgi:hypothetical protein
MRESRAQDEAAEPSALPSQVSPLPSALRAGTLTGPKRSGGPVSDGCGATSGRAAGARGGSSMWRVAQAVRRCLTQDCLSGARGRRPHRAYSLTFTWRSGSESEVRAAVLRFGSVLERRLRDSGCLFVLDRAPNTGRWHVHALAVLPPGFDATKLVVWWARRWGKHERPARVAQHVRPLATGNDIDRVLAHHLGRTRRGAPIPLIPPVAQRATAWGLLRAIWTRVCALKGIALPPQLVVASQSPPSATKPSSAASSQQVRRRRCRWCEQPLPIGVRCDARSCDSCRRSASRALGRLEGRFGDRARKSADRLARRGWSLRDAIRQVTRRYELAAYWGSPVGSTKLRPPSCACGRPLGKRLTAKTCGRSPCRTRRWRSNHRPRITGRQLLEVLFDSFGLRTWFPASEAVRFGRKFGFLPSVVLALASKVLRRGLLKYDGAVDAYRFRQAPT